MKRFITVEEARQKILERLPRLAAERVFLSHVPGRVLAETVEAPTDSPRFDNSARDGYAVRYDDLGGDRPTLTVTGTSAAGKARVDAVAPGTAVRVMTGAPVPDGADTVVMQEHCEVDEHAETVTIIDVSAIARGAWVRSAGENMARGEAVLEPGVRLGAPEVGLLASFGRSVLQVARRPRVAIVSTGDELVELDQTPGPSQIVNSNAYMLEALVTQYGGEAVVFPAAADTDAAVRDAFGQALQSADLVVSSGGVSVGEFDVTREVVEDLTGGMHFWKIRMKPGKPLAFGTRETNGQVVPLIGLPGNPNSCFVCFHQFVRPALAVMQGMSVQQVAPRRVHAVLAAPVRTTPKRRVYLSGTLRPGVGEKPEFVPFDNQNSANLRLFCQAEAFGICEEGVATMEAGSTIVVEGID